MVTTSSPNSGVTPIPVVRRGGFTLVELMVVIVVIGILAGLLLVAVNKAITKVNEARITVEIGNLQTSMQTYKQEAGGLPPTMCWCYEESNAGDVVARQNRFMRHLRKRFPRFVGSQYTDIRNLILKNYLPNDKQKPNLDNLDAAESLVFWLGGLPDLTEQAKLQGFSLDPTNPFKPGGSRTVRLYDFDPRRLTDVDNDGWWEYVPAGTSSVGNQMPPYVYFDASSYALGPQYPSPSPASGGPSVGPPFTGSPGAAWGRIGPYHVDIKEDGSSTGFQESSSFQLISAGLDSIYGDIGFTDAKQQPLWRDTTNRRNWTEFDADNLTNFHERRLDSLAK